MDQKTGFSEFFWYLILAEVCLMSISSFASYRHKLFFILHYYMLVDIKFDFAVIDFSQFLGSARVNLKPQLYFA